MFRSIPYALLFVVLFLMQLFIFDRLLISTAILPMAYVAFIILLPMQTSAGVMLLWGALIGAIFDVTMGMPGVNSIATIFLCYVRGSLLQWTVGRELIMLGGAPTVARVGSRRYFRYMILAVLIHSIILFSVEYMNLMEWRFLLRRIIYSSAVTILFVWIITRRFEQILMRRN